MGAFMSIQFNSIRFNLFQFHTCALSSFSVAFAVLFVSTTFFSSELILNLIENEHKKICERKKQTSAKKKSPLTIAVRLLCVMT